MEIKLQEKLSELLNKKKDIQKKLETAKNDFTNIQKEEKKALIMYSTIKLLSEAISIESVKNRIAKYVEDYFETKDFAFYVNTQEDFENMQLFVRGSTKNSVLPSWENIYEMLKNEETKFTSSIIINSNPLTIISPIIFNEEIIGCLAANFAYHSDTEKQKENMNTFCDEISFALKRIVLFQEIEHLSRIDGLTGVYRRNVLDDKIQEEIKRAETFKTTCGFMLVDIDHFKTLNDKYGHQFGDYILKRIGEILKSSVYETDLVARYGGEEFGIILPRAEYSGVMRKAEAIRSRIEQESFTHGFECIKISVSIGIAHFPRDGKDAKGIIAKADEALYKAKQTGRNRVIDAGSKNSG